MTLRRRQPRSDDPLHDQEGSPLQDDDPTGEPGPDGAPTDLHGVEVRYGADPELDDVLARLVNADSSVVATTRGTMRIPSPAAAGRRMDDQLTGRSVGDPGDRVC
jgi:hypothetical protein